MAITLDDTQQEIDEAIKQFRKQVDAIRIGRASPAMVENVIVDYYGNPTALKEVAAISAPEAQQILIEPWDTSALESVEKALQKSDIGVSPVVEGDRIRITLPPLTEERRKEFAKKIHDTMEQARIRIRAIREEAWKVVQEAEEDGAITEDEKFRNKDALQEMVDAANKKIEAIGDDKEEQLMTL